MNRVLLIAACTAALAAALPALALQPQDTVTVKEVLDLSRRRHTIVVEGYSGAGKSQVMQTAGAVDALDAVRRLQPQCEARIANFFRTGDPAQSDPSIPIERLMAMTLPRSAVSDGLLSAIASDLLHCLNRLRASDPIGRPIQNLAMKSDKTGLVAPRSLEETLKLGRPAAAAK